MQILFGSGKQLFPADIETEQKQSGRLEETPRIDRPKQTGLLPQRYIAPDEVANVSGFRIFSHLRIHLADFQIRQLMRRIYQTGNVVIPFYRLQKKMTEATSTALSLQLRVRNSTIPTTTNSRRTSPAGKKAAFSVANPASRTRRHKKR